MVRTHHLRYYRSHPLLLAAYVGGAFVFSGVALLISFIWDDVGSAQRVILTFATGVAALVVSWWLAWLARS